MNWDRLLIPKRFRYRDKQRRASDEYQYDYTKIVFTSAFRRMQNKTQVFPLDKNDFVRTRLTHSLETSTIASIIGSKVEKELISLNLLDEKHDGVISSILRAASLIHDIGNPPFGHFGEIVIQDYYKEFLKELIDENVDIFGNNWSEEQINDFTKFEGNAQAFRLLKKLQYIRDEHSLNLTYPVLASIIKYPWDSKSGTSDGIDAGHKKFGYFQSEKSAFTEIKNELGLKGRHPIVFLLEAADDIAYSVADIEDGCKKNILNLDLIKDSLKKHLDLDNVEEKKIFKIFEEIKLDEDYPNKLEVIINIFRIKIQKFMVDAVVECFVKNHDRILSGKFDKELLMESKAKNLVKSLKELGLFIFNTREVIKLEIAGDKILNVLLNEFSRAIISPKKDIKGSKEQKLCSLISSNYDFVNSKYKDSENKLYNDLRLITDFICGMTDSYALDLYRAISGIDL